MSGYTIRRVRRGNTIGSTGVMWTFGCETQKVYASECTQTVIGKNNMCLYGGDYYSAQYTAQPGKANGSIAFNGTLLTPPVATAGSTCGVVGSSGMCSF